MHGREEGNPEALHAGFEQLKPRPHGFNPLVYVALIVSAAVLLVAGAWVAIQADVNQPGRATGVDESDAVINTIAPRQGGEEKPAFKMHTSSTKTVAIFPSTVERVPTTKSLPGKYNTIPYKPSSTNDVTAGAATSEADTNSSAKEPSSAKEFQTESQTVASISAEGTQSTTELFVKSMNETKFPQTISSKAHDSDETEFAGGKESPAIPSHSNELSTVPDDGNELTSEIHTETTSRTEAAGDVKLSNVTSSTTAVIDRRWLNTDEGASRSVTSSGDRESAELTTERKINVETIAASQSTKTTDEITTGTESASTMTSSTVVTTTASTASDSSSLAMATAKALDPQALLCTYGAKTNASTLFPGDGLCDLIFFDSAYKNDRNFPTDSENFGLDLQHFLSVTPKYTKSAFGVGFAFEYRGTLTQDLTRTEPVLLEVFWKHGVFNFGILDVPVFGLKPYYMDDVFMCLKTLDALSQSQRESGKAAYVVLSAVPYNAGWVNYVAEKMKTVYQPDLFVSQGHYTYGDNEAITCAVVPPTSLYRPSKLLGYAHDLNTAASALRQLETQGASTRWSISVGMKGRLAAPLPKFPLEIFSPCTQNPIAPAFDAYTEVCNNQDLWQKPAYDTKNHAMLSRNTKRNMMFVYDNEESLCRKLCRVKANYTKLRFGLAAFDLDYEDYTNSCRHENKFSAFSRLQTLRKLVDYFKDHFSAPFDESGCVGLVPA
ncbi:uncharacterized protein LOC144119746 [Amblyomma americanum]